MSTGQIEKEVVEAEYGWTELEQDLDIKIAVAPKKQQPKIIYQYIEHEEAEQKINAAFDILFDEMMKIKRG